MTRRRKLTAEQADALRRWWNAPRSTGAWARLLGVSKNTVARYARGLHKGARA